MKKNSVKKITFFIPVILGTGRSDRRSKKVADFVFKKAKESKLFRTEFIDVRDFVKSARTIPSWEESKTADSWRKIAKRADGYIIIFPEYNHGYPGELKLLLDMALKEYNKKPCGICTVSTGAVGGARAAENFWQVSLELGMVPVMNPVHFMKVKDVFGTNGQVKDERYNKNVFKLFDNLIWFTKTLKYGRNNFS